MHDVTVYTTTTCPYCVRVKRFLEEEGVPFKEVNVQENPMAARRLVRETGQTSVPQTNINGHWVFGFDANALTVLLQT